MPYWLEDRNFVAASLLFMISATLTAIARLTSDALTKLPLFLLAQPILIGGLVVTAMGIPSLGLRGRWQGVLALTRAVGFGGSFFALPLLFATLPPVGGAFFLAIFAPPFVAASIVFLVAVRHRPLPLQITALVLVAVFVFMLALLPLCPGQILSYPLPASFPPRFLVCLYYPLFALPAYGFFLFLFVLTPPPAVQGRTSRGGRVGPRVTRLKGKSPK